MAMPSKMILLYGVPMFVGGCSILWMFWDRLKKPPKKKIFISADCWLYVFDLLPAYQLGLGIALISHRFDFYVDEHFKTRKWALKSMEILPNIFWNYAKEMKIVNYDDETLPIPQKPLPKKVVGFEAISIKYIDQNAIAFLHRFRPLFASNCPINLAIDTTSDRILDLIFRNIWPMFGKNIHCLELSSGSFHHLRQFAPTILNECPLLRIVTFYAIADLFPEFPADDSAAASDGQTLAKWLFTPLQSNVPKMLVCPFDTDGGIFASNLEDLKATFANASSPVNFIVVIWFRPPCYGNSVVPFDLTNELTREQLTLKRIVEYTNLFLLIRCPIVRNVSKWAKWEEEVICWHLRDLWNQIDIRINENGIGDGILDATPGPSDQQ